MKNPSTIVEFKNRRGTPVFSGTTGMATLCFWIADTSRRAACFMPTNHVPAFTLLLLMTNSCLLPPSAIQADDWQQWLGPHRDGTWAADRIPEMFPPNGPELAWKKSIGGGYSGPAVAAGYVILMDRVVTPTSSNENFVHDGEIPRNKNFVRQRLPGKERVLCFRESDGEPLWQHEYDCRTQR